MIDRLTSARQTEVNRLKCTLEATVERIRHYKQLYPAINENDFGYYLDGSRRRDFGNTGFNSPTYRTWKLETMFGRRLYLYEEIDMDGWANRANSDDLGTDAYGLALSDPSIPTYGGRYDKIAVVDIEKLVSNENFSLDMIIVMSDALERLLVNDEDFRAIAKELTDAFQHGAASKLTFI